LVRRALELGLKPSFALPADADELEKMILRAEAEKKDKNVLVESEFDREIARWIDRADKLDSNGFELLLRRAWAKLGAEEFILRLVIPFLQKVGDLWFDKTISVAHEHFASENLAGFLSNQWRPISKQAENGRAVVADLPNDFHCLGLHMASVFLALASFEVVFLGPNTPVKDIILAASEKSVVTLVIGLNQTTDIEKAAAALMEIRAAVPASVTIAVGGNETLPEIRGITQLQSLNEFSDFVRSLSEIYRG
jgi:methanogenic corrinoid protein MtbC1